MKYEVRWTETSLRELGKLDKKQTVRIVEKVKSISGRPFDFVKRLKGFDLYSLRVGYYRVIMSIDKGRLVIFVLDAGHRKSIYRKY